MLRLRSEIQHKSLLSALSKDLAQVCAENGVAASQHNQVESSKPCHSGRCFALSFDSLFCPGSPRLTSHRKHSTGIMTQQSCHGQECQRATLVGGRTMKSRFVHPTDQLIERAYNAMHSGASVNRFTLRADRAVTSQKRTK